MCSQIFWTSKNLFEHISTSERWRNIKSSVAKQTGSVHTFRSVGSFQEQPRVAHKLVEAHHPPAVLG